MIKKQLEYLERINQAITDCIGEIQYDTTDNRNMIILALYGTILEYSLSCITLLKEKKFTAIPVILRSALEANLDLMILTKNKDYENSIKLAYLNQHISIIKNIINTTPHTRFVANNLTRFQDELDRNLAIAEDLRAAGAKKFRLNEKFTEAQIDQVYTLYQSLCRESHNNLDRLIQRHIVKSDSHFKVIFFKKWEDADIAEVISFTVRFLINPFRKIQEIFQLKDSPRTGKVVELFLEYEELEKSIYANINANIGI